MCNCCNLCIEEISLEVVTNGAAINLPVNQRIQNANIKRILVRRSGSATLKSVTGKTLAADTVIATAHLILNDLGGKEKIKYPISALQRDFNSPDAYQCDLVNIDPTQCQIILDTTASGYNAAHVVEIIFGIECPKNC